MKKFTNGLFTGERALYHLEDAIIENSTFKDGESPLKECSNIVLKNVNFEYKYPLWYSKNISVSNSTFYEMSRSGIWYTKEISIKDSLVIAPKLFRRSEGITLLNVKFTNALETFWFSKDINLVNVEVNNGDYFCLGAKDITIKDFILNGNYGFDGAKNIYIENAVLNSKDSFWNTENVVLKNCKIDGEYVGWNSKNVTFIDCEIESNQGICYMDNVRLVNCTLKNTDLCFEFCSDVDAKIKGEVLSVKNPFSGIIRAGKIDKLILDKKLIELDRISVLEDE